MRGYDLGKRQFIIILFVFLVLTTTHILNSDFSLKKSKAENLNSTNSTEKYKEKKILTLNILEEAKIKNSDVYGWIVVDGTKINYPVVQHKVDDAYYLNHDEEKSETEYGAIFTEKYNSRNFRDKFTIIYGHAMKDGSMFGSLKSFNDRAFFNKHKTIKI